MLPPLSTATTGPSSRGIFPASSAATPAAAAGSANSFGIAHEHDVLDEFLNDFEVELARHRGSEAVGNGVHAVEVYGLAFRQTLPHRTSSFGLHTEHLRTRTNQRSSERHTRNKASSSDRDDQCARARHVLQDLNSEGR